MTVPNDLAGRFLIWLSGAPVEPVSQGRARSAGLGFAILNTAALAGISIAFALNTVMKVPLPVAIVCAAAWGLAGHEP